MFISPAYAQAVGEESSGIISLLPLVLIFVVFYFLLIRPQQKKMKAHRALVDAVKRGDRIVTGGGMMGTVTKVTNDNELQVEIAEGVKVKIVRGTIQEVISKTEPADKGGASPPANDDKSNISRGGSGFSISKLLGLKGNSNS